MEANKRVSTPSEILDELLAASGLAKGLSEVLLLVIATFCETTGNSREWFAEAISGLAGVPPASDSPAFIKARLAVMNQFKDLLLEEQKPSITQGMKKRPDFGVIIGGASTSMTLAPQSGGGLGDTWNGVQLPDTV